MVGGLSLTVGSKEKIIMMFKEESLCGIKKQGEGIERERERNNKILMVLGMVLERYMIFLGFDGFGRRRKEKRRKKEVLNEWSMNEMNMKEVYVGKAHLTCHNCQNRICHWIYIFSI